MSINIIALNERNEPLDLNKTNIEEQIFFFYEPEHSTSFLDLNGSEKWVWDLDYDNVGITDQVIQNIVGFVQPLPVVFFRGGLRKVKLDIFDTNSGTDVLKYTDTITFNIFKFPTEIIGASYISKNQTITYEIITEFSDSEIYEWYINGTETIISGTNSNILSFVFDDYIKALVQCRITNGTQNVLLETVTLLSVGNSSIGKKYEGNVTQDLNFFNKEGDYMNFQYIEENGVKYWDGDMIFHENSSDTFKTIGLYTLEKVAPIKFKSSDLDLRKMQLFNEYGVDFEPSYGDDILIENIQSVNNQVGFYTKWLIANNIHNIIPIGTELLLSEFYDITIDNSIPETPILTSNNLITELSSAHTTSGNISSGLTTFTVIGNRRDAVMVISDTPNINFNPNYGYGEFRLQNNAIITVPQGTIKTINLIKPIQTSDYNSEWNEPQYMNQFYDRKKLSIINTQTNDGIYTVNYIDDDETNILNSKILKTDCIDMDLLIPYTDYGFRIEITFKTNKIFLSSTPIDFLPASTNPFLMDKNILIWESTLGRDFTPGLLKENTSFSFEQLDQPVNNLDHIYKTENIAVASDIISHQTTDTDGYRLKMSTESITNSVLNITTNGISNYIITEGIEWDKGIDITESIVNLTEYINENVIGVSVIGIDDEIWIWERTGYTIKFDSVLSNNFTWTSGILLDNNPTYGVVGDQWVILNSDIYNGYVHYKTSQNLYHIAYFSGVYPDQIATWYTLPLNKKVVVVDPSDNIEYIQNLIADAYLEDNVLNFDVAGDINQDITPDIITNRFLQQYNKTLSTYGLDTYIDENNLCITRSHTLNSVDSKDDYIDVKFYKDSLSGDTSGTAGIGYVAISSDTNIMTVDLIQVIEPLEQEKNRTIGKYKQTDTISDNFERRIIIKDIDQKFGLVININGVDYDVAFDNIGGGLTEREDNILDIQETLQDWGNQRFESSQDLTPDDDSDIGRRYHEILESLGVLVWLEKSEESYIDGSGNYDTIVLQSKYPNIPIEYSINGTLDTHKILNKEVLFNEISTILTVTINRIPYSISYQGSINATLSEWVSEYYDTLILQDIIVDNYDGLILGESGTNFIIGKDNILQLSTLEEGKDIDLEIWVGKNPVLGKDLYIIEDFKKGSEGIIISGNEVIITDIDFQDLGFATAMITSINDSKFPLNNQEYNLLFVDPNIIGLSYQGAFWQNDQGLGFAEIRSGGFEWSEFDEFDTIIDSSTSGSGTSFEVLNDLILSSREFLRHPRERFDTEIPIVFKFSWEEESIQGTIDKIFYYDFSGKQLDKDIRDEGVYQYDGKIPLLDDNNVAYLNKNPNRDLSKTSDSSVQQTIFDTMAFDLPLVDSEDEIDPRPTPLQVFVGFKGDIEGVSKRTMLIHRSESISLDFNTELIDENDIDMGYKNILDFDQETSTITLSNSEINFIETGFLVGQRVCFMGQDILNEKNQAIFKNAGYRGEIVSVTVNKITFINLERDMKTESSLTKTRNEIVPFRERDAAFNIKIVVEDSLIGKIRLKGQTEVEDMRFKVMLDNFGKNINHEDVYIFKEYDIKENGIDWTFLNQKRKEMLSVYPEIYNYVGSYKAVINAINYFGYNDLEFYEYYLNVNPDTDQFEKLHKVEIPDLFNNRVDGFEPNDFILKSLPNKTYQKTKLFNLTYRITDREGNSVLAYSLEEVIIKLLGLKKWLQNELMPVGTRLRDLTGRGETVGTATLWNDIKMSRKISIKENLTPIDFNIESYIQPIENNSSTHNININFSTNKDTDIPLYYHVKITTYTEDPDINGLSRIQEINQYKTDMVSINFAVDKIADPYIIVEIICDNGYGASFNRKKSYKIQ